MVLRELSAMSVARTYVVKGTSGAGKSTFARALADRLALPYVELDALHHGPNWSEPSAEEFRARVREVMTSNPTGWVIDGNYDSKLGDTIVGVAETIVWLDLPLGVKLRRLWGRTLDRILNDVELWNGNRETWGGAFIGKESLFGWTFQSHVRHRRDWPRRFSGDPRLVRLRSEAEARRWLQGQAHPREKLT
jgi:adenylate kinase family enzyme